MSAKCHRGSQMLCFPLAICVLVVDLLPQALNLAVVGLYAQTLLTCWSHSELTSHSFVFSTQVFHAVIADVAMLSLGILGHLVTSLTLSGEGPSKVTDSALSLACNALLGRAV